MTRASQYVLAALMGLSSLAAYYFTPHRVMAVAQPVDLQAMLPASFGSWHRVVVSTPVIDTPEREANIRSIYAQVHSEVYANDNGESIMLSVAYTDNQSDNSGKQSHKPEICYPAQGFQISQIERGTLQTSSGTIPVKRMLAVSGARQEPLTYWSTIGNRVAASGVAAKLDQLYYGFHGDIPDGVVFRVSSLSSEPAQAYAVQQTFVDALLRAMTPTARLRLAGLEAS